MRQDKDSWTDEEKRGGREAYKSQLIQRQWLIIPHKQRISSNGQHGRKRPSPPCSSTLVFLAEYYVIWHSISLWSICISCPTVSLSNFWHSPNLLMSGNRGWWGVGVRKGKGKESWHTMCRSRELNNVTQPTIAFGSSAMYLAWWARFLMASCWPAVEFSFCFVFFYVLYKQNYGVYGCL